MSCSQVIVTETKQGLSFWAQHVDSGEQTDSSCKKARGMTFYSRRDTSQNIHDVLLKMRNVVLIR